MKILSFNFLLYLIITLFNINTNAGVSQPFVAGSGITINGNVVSTVGNNENTLWSQTVEHGVTNSVTATSIMSQDVGTYTGSIPANWWAIGKVLHFHAEGYFFTQATPGNVTFTFLLAATNVVSTGANAFPVSVNNGHWHTDIYLICRTTGSSGTLAAYGKTELNNIAALTTSSYYQMPSSPPATYSIDTTQAAAPDFKVTMSVAAGDAVFTEVAFAESK